MTVAAYTAMRDLVRDLRELSRHVRHFEPIRSDTPGGHRPAAFARYADPQGRFELRYPSSWALQTHTGVHVSSTRIGSFARVDATAAAGDPWDGIEEALAQAGVKAAIALCRGAHVRGTLEVDPVRYAWHAWAYACGPERLILSLGNVIDARHSRLTERYEDRVLAAIRRNFKVRSK